MGSACGPPIFLRGKLPGEPPSSTREPRMFPKAKIHKLTFLSQVASLLEDRLRTPLFGNYGTALNQNQEIVDAMKPRLVA